MPIYIESRDLDNELAIFAEHQYLIYVPEGDELNYGNWQCIGAFPSDLEAGVGVVVVFFTGTDLINDEFRRTRC